MVISRLYVTEFRDFALTVLVVFLFTALALLVSGAPPVAAFYYILQGSLGSWIKFAHVIKAWIPLTLCACGLLFTFRIGLWNIGVEGQMMMGAVLSTAVLRIGVHSQMTTIIIAGSILAGVIGGTLWALLAGVLKIKGGVNEIFAGLGLNFVAQGLILWLIFGAWRRPGVASMSGTETFPMDLWLPVWSALRVSPPALLIVIASIGATALLLRYSRVGLNLRAVGNNPAAACLFGLRPGVAMLLAMLFAGGFAGIAGSLQVSSVYHRLIPSISSNYGYLALLIVMLCNYNIWLIPPVALFFACLNVGSIQLPMMLQLDSSLSGVIQGASVLALIAVHGWKVYRMRRPVNRPAHALPGQADRVD